MIIDYIIFQRKFRLIYHRKMQLFHVCNIWYIHWCYRGWHVSSFPCARFLQVFFHNFPTEFFFYVCRFSSSVISLRSPKFNHPLEDELAEEPLSYIPQKRLRRGVPFRATGHFWGAGRCFSQMEGPTPQGVPCVGRQGEGEGISLPPPPRGWCWGG